MVELPGDCEAKLGGWFGFSVNFGTHSFLSLRVLVFCRISDCCMYVPLSLMRVYALKVMRDPESSTFSSVSKFTLLFLLVSVAVGSNLQGVLFAGLAERRRVVQQTSVGFLCQVVCVDFQSSSVLYRSLGETRLEFSRSMIFHS